MILILEKDTTQQGVDALHERLKWMGMRAHPREHEGCLSLVVVSGEDGSVRPEMFAHLPGVKQVLPFTKPYKLVSRESRRERTLIRVGSVCLGGDAPVIMAGPCAVESEELMHATAAHIRKAGAQVLRGGAFKPRTSPYAFQGLGEEGLKYLSQAARAHDLHSVSEVMAAEEIDAALRWVDILQVGARNMQNFSLLKAVGQAGKPVLLKRGFSATYTDLLMAAEYILSAGNTQVILCERGIRTFETYTRNTLDIAAVPIIKELSHLPIIVDPSHGTGLRKFVTPMARAAVAAGADGIMVEIHPRPDEALSDGPQSLTFEAFDALMDSIRVIASIREAPEAAG